MLTRPILLSIRDRLCFLTEFATWNLVLIGSRNALMVLIKLNQFIFKHWDVCCPDGLQQYIHIYTCTHTYIYICVYICIYYIYKHLLVVLKLSLNRYSKCILRISIKNIEEMFSGSWLWLMCHEPMTHYHTLSRMQMLESDFLKHSSLFVEETVSNETVGIFSK